MRFGIEHKRVDRFLIFNEMGPQAEKNFNEFKIFSDLNKIWKYPTTDLIMILWSWATTWDCMMKNDYSDLNKIKKCQIADIISTPSQLRQIQKT